MLKLIFKTFSRLVGEERLLTYISTGVNRGLIGLKQSGYLYETGWSLSYERKMSIDKYEQPIPWLSFPFIDFLETRLHKDITIFEYGGGNSTLYYSNHVKEVYTVESDMEWLKSIKQKAPSNVHLYYEDVSKGADLYIKRVSLLNKKFNLIIVDGLYRKECLLFCLDSLTDDGVIVVDDSREYDYGDSINKVLDQGFKKIDFSGMSSFVITHKTTSILYRNNNCFQI